MEIIALTSGHSEWEAAKQYAAGCPWRGGAYLAEQMAHGAFEEWERVFIARENGKIVAFCNFTAKDELAEEYDFTPFIGCVFVEAAYRGNRLSERLIGAVLAYAGEIGYQSVYIMSGETGLYEKYGFSLLGDYRTAFGTTEQLFVKKTAAEP